MGLTSVLHGCIENWDPARQAMRMYAPEESLRRHLTERPTPYVDPEDGGDGDVLTIDDSTHGAARACLLARQLGHAVTLFLNPSQIISGRDYWFSRFDALVDARRASTVEYARTTYDLRSRQGLRDFRWVARAQLLVSREDVAHRLLDDIAVLLQAGQPEVLHFARSIRLAELAALREAGVRFGSHGWDHQSIGSLSPAEQLSQVADTRDWLRETTGREPRDHAIPFGQERLDARARAAVPGIIYLVSPTPAPDSAGEGYRYRLNLTPSLQAGYG